MGDGMKRAKAAAKGPTVAQRAALESAAADEAGIWCPVGAGQHAMAGRMAGVLGWGDFTYTAGVFTINAAGRAAAKHGEG